jgi:3-methylfumaryl-CoA hydratase
VDDAELKHLQSWIGKQSVLTDTLPNFPVQALASAFDHSIVLNRGGTLPCPWHWLYFLPTPTHTGTGEDGHPKKGGFLPPVPLPRRMWAAGEMRIEQPLIIGEVAEKTSTVKSVEAKTGRTGPLVFVNVLHEIRQRGQLCISEQQNLVYREAPKQRAELPAGKQATEIADFTREVTPDSVLLFRYSALTYNSHRIHYDREYAVNTELYPALVVHGPLLATLLVELIYDTIPGATIKTFAFKAIRPTFDTHPFTLCAKRNGNELSLWTVDHQGNLCMTANATID